MLRRYLSFTMSTSKFQIITLLMTTTLVVTYATSNYYSFARIESCSGCQLNSLPDVKKFIFEDVPNYENVEFKHIHGAPPELVLFDSKNEEVERLKLSRLSREECNELLETKGFKKKPVIVKDEI